jgi:uncharacterized protein (DUF2062 family)
MLGFRADMAQMQTLIDNQAPISAWLNWLASDAAPAMLFGLFVISVIAAAVGYVLAAWFWRWRTASRWRRRHKA